MLAKDHNYEEPDDGEEIFGEGGAKTTGADKTLFTILKDLRKFIVVRVPEIFASYIEDKEYDLKFIRKILKLKGFDIVVLCRYEEQLKKFKEKFSSDSRVIIPDKVVDSVELLRKALAFVGMGGTMTWESCLLGVPTVSLWKGPKLYLEDYLSKKGLLCKVREEDEALLVLKNMIEDQKLRRKIKKKAERILNSMEDPIKKIVEEVEKFEKNL